MSAVVGVWVNELEKIKDKVRIKNPLVLSRKSRKGGRQVVDEEGGEGTKEFAQKGKNGGGEGDESMSESTVFLLMDRFAAW